MKRNARAINRFKGYSVDDCDCKYCLYFAGKGKPCPLEICCCAEERAEAISCVNGGKTHSSTALIQFTERGNRHGPATDIS